MFRQLAVIAVLACAVLAAPIENFDEIPEEYKSLIPPEVAEHLKSITAEEKTILKELAQKHKDFKNEDEILAALKEKSASLHEKVVKLKEHVKGKLDNLGTEAKEFVQKIFEEGRELHRQYLAGTKPSLEELKAKVKAHLEGFNKLSDGAKEEFKAQFPLLSKAVSNPTVQGLINKHIDN